MTIYKGKVKYKELIVRLQNALVAEGYTQVSSDPVTEWVYRSPAQPGFDPFFIKLKDPLIGAYLTIGIYEMYTPNVTNGLPGTFGNGYEGTGIAWNTSGQPDRTEVDYLFNISARRAVILTEGMKAESGNLKNILYIGFPIRYDQNDKQAYAAAMASTCRAPHSGAYWRALRNRALVVQQNYEYDFYPVARSIGWAKKLFFSPLFLGTNAEGARGELDGLYIMEKGDASYELTHGDTFSRDGKTYMVFTPSANGNSSLPSGYDYLIEI